MVGALNAGGCLQQGQAAIAGHIIADTLTAPDPNAPPKDGKRQDGSRQDKIPIVIDRAAFNQGENAQYEPEISESESTPPIVARGPHAVAFKASHFTRGKDGAPAEITPPLKTTASGDQDANVLAFNIYPVGGQGADLEASPTDKANLGGGYGKSERGTRILQEPPEDDVAHSLTAQHGATEDGTGRGTPLVADTPPTEGTPAYGFNGDQSAQTRSMGEAEEQAPTLRSGFPTHVTPPVYRKAQKAHDPDDIERWEEAEHANTLSGHGTTTSEVALYGFDPGQGDKPKTTDQMTEDGMPPLTTAGRMAVSTAIPRRLTPTECERLQGFPDGWTEEGVEEDGVRVELKDGPRYRMMGNAVTVDVIEWIGRRLGHYAKGTK